MFDVACCVSALLVGEGRVLFLLVALIIFDVLSCFSLLLSVE